MAEMDVLFFCHYALQAAVWGKTLRDIADSLSIDIH
jgi:hypothetical protein